MFISFYYLIIFKFFILFFLISFARRFSVLLVKSFYSINFWLCCLISIVSLSSITLWYYLYPCLISTFLGFILLCHSFTSSLCSIQHGENLVEWERSWDIEKRNIQNSSDSVRPAHRDEEWPPLAAAREGPRTETKTQHSQK